MLLKKKKRNICLALLTFVFILGGCGVADGNEKLRTPVNPVISSDYECLESEPVLDYNVPTILPGIFLNQNGYETDAIKIALVKGKKLPEQFSIVNTKTEDIVYTGYLKEKEFIESLQEYIGYIDFTDFTEEGTYFIRCDIIGYSYDFTVKQNVYKESLMDSLDAFSIKQEDISKDNLISVCDSLSVLLLSHELYGTVYDRLFQEDEISPILSEIKLYVEQLANYQDINTGAVMDGEAPLYEETAWLAAVLAKFSYSYQKYDSNYANACLQAADKAWKYLEKESKNIDDSLLFYGATELYRATGKGAYHTALRTLGADIPLEQSNEPRAFGTLTYASTKRWVDMDLCGDLLDVLLKKAELIAEQAKQDVFETGSSLSEDNPENVLWNGVIVASIDYVITNHEYATMIEHYVDYVSGKNELAKNYVFFDRDKQDLDIIHDEDKYMIGSDYKNTARYIMLLSEILSHKQEE